MPSSRSCLPDAIQSLLCVEFAHFPQSLLEPLPRFDSLTNLAVRSIGHVIACGPAGLAPLAHVKVGSMLRSSCVTAAARIPAAAIALRGRAKDRDPSQLLDFLEQPHATIKPRSSSCGHPVVLLVSHARARPRPSCG